MQPQLLCAPCANYSRTDGQIGGGGGGNKNMEFNQPPATVFSTTVLDSHMGNGAIKGFYTVISN